MYAALGKIAATTTSPVVGPDGEPHINLQAISRTKGKPWAGLGKHVEVLFLEENVAKGLEKLAL